MPDSLNRIMLHGYELSYVDVGQGPAVVFVHGLMSSHRTWGTQLERLARRHRVVAPDLFGHGDSDKPVGDYSLGAHAATLRDLFDALDIRSATLVGHSLGGGIAMQFAYLFPDRVNGVVLVSSGGLGPELHPLLRAATLPGSEFVLPVLASEWVHNVGDTALKIWSKTGLPGISPSSSEAWQSLTSLADGDTRRAFLATSRSVIDMHGQTVSARNRLGSIAGLPTMLLWGGSDRMIPSAHVEAAREELPASRVEDLRPRRSLPTPGRTRSVRAGARGIHAERGAAGRHHRPRAAFGIRVVAVSLAVKLRVATTRSRRTVSNPPGTPIVPRHPGSPRPADACPGGVDTAANSSPTGSTAPRSPTPAPDPRRRRCDRSRRPPTAP